MEKWYKRSLWRNLVDMHIPDWNPSFMSRFDPELYAALMDEAKTDACELYAGNCLGICFFPTKAGHMHKGLMGRDQVGETLAELHRRGKTRIVYFNLWSRWAFDTHPQWRILSKAGHNTMQNDWGELVSRFGQCCINSPGYRDYVARQIRQLCEDYEFEGLWIDMCGWHGNVCYCPACREKYLAETGEPLPEEENWDDPRWMRFQRFRERSVREINALIRETAHSVRPELSVVFQSAFWPGDWKGAASADFLALSEYLAGDFYGDPLKYSVICKALNSLTPNRPFEFMTSRCYDLYDHTTNKSEDELRFSACAALAHNGAFTFIDAIDPEGTMDGRLYRTMGRLRDELAPCARYWKPDSRMCSDVVFYYNFTSNFDARRGASWYTRKGFSLRDRMTRVAETMIGEHIPFDFAFRNGLEEATRTAKLIVLSDVFALDDGEAGLLRAFVRRGGRLIVTGLSGLYDPLEGRREDFALGDLMGLSFDGQTEEDVVYFRPLSEQGLWAGFGEKYPMSVRCPAARVRLNGARALASVTLPWSGTREVFRFGSAISDPPGRPTGLPAVTENRFGEGRVMYIAAPFEDDPKAPQKKVFAALVRSMLPDGGKTAFTVDAPSWLEAMLYDDGDGRFRLFLINAMEKYEKATAVRVRIGLRLSGVGRITDVLSGRELPFTVDGDCIRLELGEVTDFCLLLLET